MALSFLFSSHLSGSLTPTPVCVVTVSLWAWLPVPACLVSPLLHMSKEATSHCSAEFPVPAVTWAEGKKEIAGHILIPDVALSLLSPAI